MRWTHGSTSDAVQVPRDLSTALRARPTRCRCTATHRAGSKVGEKDDRSVSESDLYKFNDVSKSQMKGRTYKLGQAHAPAAAHRRTPARVHAARGPARTSASSARRAIRMPRLRSPRASGSRAPSSGTRSRAVSTRARGTSSAPASAARASAAAGAAWARLTTQRRRGV
jgi:hypothetical protein